MSISLKLLDNPNDISRKINNVINNSLPKILKRAVNPVLDTVRQFFIETIKEDPTFRAISEDTNFRVSLGIVEPQPLLDYLVNYLADNINITIDKNIFNLVLLRPGYTAIADDPRFIITELTVSPLPWLHWLLEEGSDVIIETHHVFFGDFTNRISHGVPFSRTGLAIMKKGDFFTLPQIYGPYIESDNFVTRAFMFLIEEHTVETLMEQQIEEGFNGLRL